MSTATAQMQQSERREPNERSEHKDGGGAHAVAHSILNRMAMIAIQICTGILTARMLQPRGRGELAAMILWPLFLASVTTLGIPSSLIYFLRKHTEGHATLILNGVAMSVTFGCVAAGVSALLMPRWLHQYSPSVVHGAQLFLLTVPLCSMMLAGQATLEAFGKFTYSNIVQILVPSATLAMLLLFLFTHHFNPFTAAISYVAAAVPVTLLIYYFLWRERTASTGWKWSPSACRMLLSYGIRSYGIDLLGTLALQVDTVLVISLLQPSAMGVYAVMLSLSRMLSLFQSAVVMVLFPKTAGKPLEEIVELTEVAMRISVMITAACAAILCFLGPVLIGIMYGRPFLSAVGALRLLLVEATISCAVAVLAQAFMAVGRPGIVTILQAIGLGLCIPMMLLLIPRWGVAGAAASLLLSTTARFLFIYFGFRVFLRTRMPRLVPKLDDFRFIASVVRSRMQRSAEIPEAAQ